MADAIGSLGHIQVLSLVETNVCSFCFTDPVVSEEKMLTTDAAQTGNDISSLSVRRTKMNHDIL